MPRSFFPKKRGNLTNLPPTGKLSTEPRTFKDIVADLRHVVFSVIRDRPNAAGGVTSFPMGTGFFVAPKIFITCDHVINPTALPHLSGDSYRLIANLTGTSATVHTLPSPQIGNEILQFPNLDLAVLKVDSVPDDHPFAALSYNEVQLGEELGIVGYPLASLTTDPNGDLRLEGLIYRTAKGSVSARYSGTLNPNAPDLPVVEVNFMFVTGNSGGPAFEADTGRVIGMVQGITWRGIAEEKVQTNIQQLPLGLSSIYIARIHAIYSLAIKLDCFRTALEGLGVSA